MSAPWAVLLVVGLFTAGCMGVPEDTAPSQPIVEADPGPTHVTEVFRLKWSCTVGAIYGFAGCDLFTQGHTLGFEVAAGWNTTLIEIVGSNAATPARVGEGVAVLNFQGKDGRIAACLGTYWDSRDPSVFRIQPNQSIPNSDRCTSPRKFPDHAYQHFATVNPGGLLANETQPLYCLGCPIYGQGRSGGIAWAAGVNFVAYATVFIGAAPADDYTAIPK